MNLSNYEHEIDYEVKKMNFIDLLSENIVSTESLIERFGFGFVKNFVVKMDNTPNDSYHLFNKAKVVLKDLRILYPIEDYPERWL